MVKVKASQAPSKFNEWVEYVRSKEAAVIVTGPEGDLVRIVPIPKPVGKWKGRKVYKLKDVQYLDFPYWQ
jgi:hypothetical protein